MADLTRLLEGIDLANVTLADLGRITNPALRNALLDIVASPTIDAAAGHQNHGSHSNHATEAARFIELEFLARRGAAGGG